MSALARSQQIVHKTSVTDTSLPQSTGKAIQGRDVGKATGWEICKKVFACFAIAIGILLVTASIASGFGAAWGVPLAFTGLPLLANAIGVQAIASSIYLAVGVILAALGVWGLSRKKPSQAHSSAVLHPKSPAAHRESSVSSKQITAKQMLKISPDKTEVGRKSPSISEAPFQVQPQPTQLVKSPRLSDKSLSSGPVGVQGSPVTSRSPVVQPLRGPSKAQEVPVIIVNAAPRTQYSPAPTISPPTCKTPPEKQKMVIAEEVVEDDVEEFDSWGIHAAWTDAVRALPESPDFFVWPSDLKPRSLDSLQAAVDALAAGQNGAEQDLVNKVDAALPQDKEAAEKLKQELITIGKYPAYQAAIRRELLENSTRRN